MKKKQIAVFDFKTDDCVHTAAIIREYVGQEADIVEYTENQMFSHSFRDRCNAKQTFDMVFIGVDDMPGIELARNIREMSNDCPMLLVSSVIDFGLEGFRLYALDYLPKPVTLDRVIKAVRRAEKFTRTGGVVSAYV